MKEKKILVSGATGFVGSGIQSRILDVINYVMEITNSKSNIFWRNYKPRDYDSQIWVANIDKTKKYFNWNPKNNLKQGLEKTIEWFRINKQVY